MRKTFDAMRADRSRREDFLSGARDEIRADNLRVACNTCVFTVLILLGCLVVTSWVIDGWSPSPYHIAFVPAMLALTVVANLYRARSTTLRLATPLCLLIEVVVADFAILIDTIGSPHAPTVFTPIVIVALAAMITLPLKGSWAVAALLSAVYAAMALAFKDPRIAQYDVLSAMVALVFSVCVAYIVMGYRVAMYETQSHYRDLSMHDDLSEVLNKRTLLALIEGHFASAGPSAPCTLVFFDVDDLKTINDTRGHMTGDELLRAVGDLLQGSFRSTDVVGRFGGDEYVVFIPEAIEKHVLARKIASIRAGLSAWSAEKLGFAATISAGAVVAAHGHHDVNELMRSADDALYEAKRGGKDRLCLRDCEVGAEGSGDA